MYISINWKANNAHFYSIKHSSHNDNNNDYYIIIVFMPVQSASACSRTCIHLIILPMLIILCWWWCTLGLNLYSLTTFKSVCTLSQGHTFSSLNLHWLQKGERPRADVYQTAHWGVCNFWYASLAKIINHGKFSIRVKDTNRNERDSRRRKKFEG